MPQQLDRSTSASWARFRFLVVGSLLSSPPARGQLKAALRALADKTWTHPVSGGEVRFSVVTIERWYYTAQRAKDDPVGVLRGAVRRDCGKVTVATALAEFLRKQYHDHPHWSYQLHYDNLAARVKAEPALGSLRSYVTVRRYMQAHGMVRKPRPASHGRPGEARAEKRREDREIRSYEAEYVGSLWHLDFHHGSLKVLTACSPVAASTGPGHPRRSLAAVLPLAVVSLGDRGRSCPRALPGDPEAGAAPGASDRQRRGDDRR
jgi:putative transposase